MQDKQKKIKNNFINFLKENYKSIIFLAILIVIVNLDFPYYIEAPGGTINLTERIDNNYDSKKGSLNMLYVTNYKGNVITLLLGKIMPNWDINELSREQVSNETQEEIYIRNRIMLENSIQNATFVAYKEAGKDITINGQTNYVIATTKDNGIKIGDIVKSIDGNEVENVQTIQEYLNAKKENDAIKIKIIRNNKEKDLEIKLDKDKKIGVMLTTNYQYELSERIPINFKYGEGGSSGGLILSIGMYQALTNEDLLKGKKIAGTGTIDINGYVGEIDGVKYKIAGAAKNKVDIVLVSPANYNEAKKVIEDNKYDIELVKVEKFKDAIEYLKNRD